MSGQQNDGPDLRGLMFSIAYGMTGSVTEAEDLVQEAFFRLERARRSGVKVESPKAYVATATTRLAIDHLRSARARRESYTGTWLPEPIVADLDEGPEQMAELSDSLSMALLVVLESLSPPERAVFLLREVFDYPYEEIAPIVDRSEANCRQIFARARQRIQTQQVRFAVANDQSEALLQSFLTAAREGDLNRLIDLLAADVVLFGDGGGKAGAIREPLYGRDRVASLILGLFEQAGQLGIVFEPALVNGGPGIITRDAQGRVGSVLSLEVLDGVIQTLRGIVNPDKLQHLGEVSDIARLRPDGGGQP
jgi:RNA polymerase sigma-70 factor (TIGR02957 family)